MVSRRAAAKEKRKFIGLVSFSRGPPWQDLPAIAFVLILSILSSERPGRGCRRTRRYK
jgi:hypothetical protein